MNSTAPDSALCFCDSRGLGVPGVSCGDCPTRDYLPSVYLAADGQYKVSGSPNMPAAKTNAERQAAFRQRKATEVRGIFAHPDDHAEVKEAAAKIARRRQRAAKRGAP